MYLTRNFDYQGSFLVEGNVCYDNGINGLVVHKSNRATVTGNTVFSNGKVIPFAMGRW